jgi:NAD/NADP transhydrogenase beta subunit
MITFTYQLNNTDMITAYKFIGSKGGLFDFVECTAIGKSIEEVQFFLESKGWNELEFVTTKKPNGHEQYAFNS